jgi:hypothetical protein
MAPLCYRRHRFPPEIIQRAIWLYLRFTPSYRDVEELLAERGDISYETVRRWVLKFGSLSSTPSTGIEPGMAEHFETIGHPVSQEKQKVMIRVTVLYMIIVGLALTLSSCSQALVDNFLCRPNSHCIDAPDGKTGQE